jgi:hypothetical protein
MCRNKGGKIVAHIDGVISVSQRNKTITIGDKVYPFPKGMTGYSVATINNKSYIDGFELVNGEWKKTLKAFWYKYF